MSQNKSTTKLLLAVKKHTPSGKGERGSLKGYNAQTRYQIELILQYLLSDELVKIEFASIHAGMADDLKLELKNKINFYQFRYQHKKISYSDFIGKNNLLGKLVESWKIINHEYAKDLNKKQLKIFFITNSQANTREDRNIPINKVNPPQDRSFQAFIQEVLIPFKKKKKIARSWGPALNKWFSACRLSRNEFDRFHQSFSIVTLHSPEENRLVNKEDADCLYKLFQDLIANSSMNEKIEKTAQELKTILGDQRFKLKNIHDLPLPDLYSPIINSKKALTNSILKINQGYVALLGIPGSGKTSLITDVKKSLPGNIRVISYYCHYIYDEPFKPPRGELVSFYHDLTKLIDKELNNKPTFLHRENDLDALRKKLREQLNLLVNDFRNKKIKTVIFIDGLDHIERPDELKITQSFLSELPKPSQLKDGIVFAIGSQRLNLINLDSSINSHIENDNNRLVLISPLTRTETIAILKKSSLYSWLGYGVNNYIKNGRILSIHNLTEGLPLATAYLIQWIKTQNNWKITNPDSLIKRLQDRPELINQDYEGLWKELCSVGNLDMVSYVAELSRLQGSIDFEWVGSWKEYRKENSNLISKFKHFFKRSSSGKRQFLHSSFRLFLIKKSIESWNDQDVQKNDRKIHLKLAKRCLNAPQNVQYRWNSIYHLAYGGEIERVFKIATEDFFLEQYLSFRPIDRILDEVSFCLRLAAENKKSFETMKYIFLSHRYLHALNVWQLSSFEKDFQNILFTNNNRSALYDRIENKLDSLENDRPYREVENALQKLHLINFLLSIGEENKANDIFQKININDWFDSEFLQIQDNFSDQDKLELPAYWAYTALNYIGIDEVLKVLSKLKWTFKSMRRKKDIRLNRVHIHRNILIELCHKLSSSKSLSNFDYIVQILEKGISLRSLPFWYVDLLLSVASNSAGEISKKYYDILLNKLTINRLKQALNKNDDSFQGVFNLTARTTSLLFYNDFNLALKYGKLMKLESALKLCADLVEKEWSNDVSNILFALETVIIMRVINGNWKDEDVDLILRQLQTQRMISDKDRWESFKDYAKSRIMLAVIKGTVFLRNYRGKKYNRDIIKNYAEYILTYSFKKTTISIDYRYLNNSKQPGNFRYLISNLSNLGADGISILKELFTGIIKSDIEYYDEINEYLIEEFHRLNLVRLLKKYKRNLLSKQSPLGANTDSIENCFRKARICTKFDNITQSNNYLKQALKFAFSENSEKDHQLSELMEWIRFQLKDKNRPKIKDILTRASHHAYLADQTGTSGADAGAIIFNNLFTINPQTAFNYLTEFICPKIGWNEYSRSINHLIQESYNKYISAPKRQFDRSSVPLFVTLFNIFCLSQKHYLAEETISSARILVILAKDKGTFSKLNVANRMIRAIKYLWPASDDRKKIFHAIVSAIEPESRRKLELNLDDIPDIDDPALKEGTEQPYSLRLRSQTYHREEVVDVLLKDFSKIKQLIEGEISDEEYQYRNFDWGEVLERGLHLLNTEKLNAIAEMLIKAKDQIHEHRSAQDLLKFLIILFKRNELRNYKLAEEFSLKVLNNKNEEASRGWARHFDGEHRLLACYLLCLIDFQTYNPLSFDKFYEGLKGDRGVSIYGLVMQSIMLSEIFAKNKLKAIADFVAKDRETMFSGFHHKIPTIKCFSETQLAKTQNIISAVIKVLINQFSLPLNYLVKRSYSELEWLFGLYKKEILTAINERFLSEEDELTIDRLLIFLEKVLTRINEKDVQLIVEGLERCCHEQNYSIVTTSRRILNNFNLTISNIPQIVNAPVIIVPSEQRIERLGQDDNLDYLMGKYGINPLFQGQVSILAEQTNKTKREVLQKLQTIMCLNKNGAAELKEKENLFQNRCSSIRSSYIRLSVLACRDAILRYLHYLQIKDWNKYDLPDWADSIFRGHDPHTVGIFPIGRPSWLSKDPRPANINFYNLEDSIKWVADVQKIEEKLPKKFINKDWVLISEYKESSFGSDILCTETKYFSVLPDKLTINISKGCFNQRMLWKTDNIATYRDYYSNNIPKTDIYSLVLKLENYNHFDSCVSWFGLHPLYAKMLKLKPSLNTFPPIWLDKNNQIACKTIYWQEGGWNHSHYFNSEPANTGWLVLLKRKLFNNLEAELGKKFEELFVVERKCYDYKKSQYEPYAEDIKYKSSWSP